MIQNSKRKLPRRGSTYSQRTDRIRAWGEATKNCTPLIALGLIWLAYYLGAPSALLTLAMIWARPP
jgi:hypothetical protein